MLASPIPSKCQFLQTAQNRIKKGGEKRGKHFPQLREDFNTFIPLQTRDAERRAASQRGLRPRKAERAGRCDRAAGVRLPQQPAAAPRGVLPAGEVPSGFTGPLGRCGYYHLQEIEGPGFSPTSSKIRGKTLRNFDKFSFQIKQTSFL